MMLALAVATTSRFSRILMDNSFIDQRSIDRRVAFGSLAGIAISALPVLAACGGPHARTDSEGLDDGSSELTAAYVATRTAGRSTMFVRANYFSGDRQQDIRLQPGAIVSANGVALKEDPEARSSYIADVPAQLTIEYKLIRRVGASPLVHSLELPYLQVESMPDKYKEGGEFRVALRPGPPPNSGVIEDHVSMVIRGPRGETRLRRADESRFPDITLVPWQQSALPPGNYSARIFRQQRYSLSRISNSRSGWAVVSHGLEFVLNVG